MDTESTTPPNDDRDTDTGTDTDAGTTAPPLPDDPRVPRIDDADTSTSQELGGAAPAVG